jgi:hypothetical protein
MAMLHYQLSLISSTSETILLERKNSIHKVYTGTRTMPMLAPKVASTHPQKAIATTNKQHLELA